MLPYRQLPTSPPDPREGDTHAEQQTPEIMLSEFAQRMRQQDKNLQGLDDDSVLDKLYAPYQDQMSPDQFIGEVFNRLQQMRQHEMDRRRSEDVHLGRQKI